MVLFGQRNNGHHHITKVSLSIEDYLKERGVTQNAIVEVSAQRDNIVEEFLQKHGVDEDALRTVEGRKGAELKHRLTARMILLWALLAPMVVIPFWLMWILSPVNIKSYSERMQVAFLGALASDVLGLCWIVTGDLFPQGKGASKKDTESEKDTPNDKE